MINFNGAETETLDRLADMLTTTARQMLDSEDPGTGRFLSPNALGQCREMLELAEAALEEVKRRRIFQR